MNLKFYKERTWYFYLVLCGLFCFQLSSGAQSEHINTSLNGKWRYIVDPYENGHYNYRYEAFDQMDEVPRSAYFMDDKPEHKTDGLEYNFDTSQTILVPGDWNTQVEKLFYYEGTLWYRRKFSYNKKQQSNRVFLKFGAVNYHAEVYLNGKKLGEHVGGFTPFSFEITNQLQAVNSLIVKVNNNRKRDAVPTVNTDWFNYGGITRSVTLEEVAQTYIKDYTFKLEGDNTIAGTIVLDGHQKKNQNVTIEIPELKPIKTITTDAKGVAAFEFKVKKLQKWSPENPKLYRVSIYTNEDKATDNIGFKTITTDGPDILLNGESIFLRGISIHAESPLKGGGRIHTKEDARILLQWAKELNCNYVRLAHYPHSEDMVQLADEMGLMVWSEIPVYWTITWGNPGTHKNAMNQLTEMVTRDKNRASIIIWSVANETPPGAARNKFLADLTKRVKELDNTRLVSAAMEKHRDKTDCDLQIVEDVFADITDIVAFNEYVGWYDGLPEYCDQVRWKIPYNKPVVISEFGGGALQGFHGDALTRWSEEYQEDMYVRSLRMLEKIPQLRGMTPWILADFRSPRRMLPVIQDGWNRKGLIGETGVKKKAFWVLKNYYDKKQEQYKITR
ncbi:glycoside hydrolase family 2 TIM barrel-domain containing protein [Tamlana sp. 2201CG12-4]|uniref:glycoside hydrolase family 2 protein n=1 Tax=Tamlana sp. 2201CG12-4 TaxID=3112582 RepID=UPI002DBD17EE|nr:glycoside hydrolase family 2 TIM barrel-domain containing protein [Tamlana sp. 2201CG12-4]MEC3908499.1 glycoside hydrolase family 2 TIM barrel-domain containing protein [Tamlana sp. 2201CG12-4]